MAMYRCDNCDEFVQLSEGNDRCPKCEEPIPLMFSENEQVKCVRAQFDEIFGDQ